MYIGNIQRNVVLYVDYNNKDMKERLKNLENFKSINQLISNFRN